MTRREAFIGVCYNEHCRQYRECVKKNNKTGTCTIGVIVHHGMQNGYDCPHCGHGIQWVLMDKFDDPVIKQGIFKKQIGPEGLRKHQVLRQA